MRVSHLVAALVLMGSGWLGVALVLDRSPWAGVVLLGMALLAALLVVAGNATAAMEKASEATEAGKAFEQLHSRLGEVETKVEALSRKAALNSL